MKKIFLLLLLVITSFSQAQGNRPSRLKNGIHLVPTDLGTNPKTGFIKMQATDSIPYIYNGIEWVSLLADDGLTIENIAPLVLETYIVDLQNGNDITGQYQNGAQPYRTLQAALDDAASRDFEDYKNINFRIVGTGTAFITKKHSNINCNFYAVDGANISYENYVPLSGDLVVLEGNLNTSDDRKAQNMHFQYYTDGTVTFGNTAGDVLDFGRGFDLTVFANNLIGLQGFQFGRIQRLNIDVLTTTWNAPTISGNVGGLADTRVNNVDVNLGDITINTATAFSWGIGSGSNVNFNWNSLASTSITGLLRISGIATYTNTATYKIGSVNTPNVANGSYVVNTLAELMVDLSNVNTWSNNVFLSYDNNDNVTFTGTGDFTSSTAPIARYRLKFKDADIKINSGVITNQSGVSDIALFLDNTNVEYSNFLIQRSGTPANYVAPNFKIKGTCYIDNLGSQTDIFDALDPSINYNQSIEIDGKLITYNVTYDGSGSNGGAPNTNIVVNQHITQESNAPTGGGGGSAETASSIKTKYESNNNTNAFTDAEQTKLTSIENNATADQTGTEIVAAIDSELGQTDWKNGSQTQQSNTIEHKNITTNYTLVLDDASKVLVNNGLGDETIEIPDNATLPYPNGSVLSFFAKQTTDTLRVSFLNGGTRYFVKTKQKTFGNSSFSVVFQDTDEIYPLGDFDFYTPIAPNRYIVSNAIGDDTNAVTGINANTTTISSVANTLTNIAPNDAFMLRVVNGATGTERNASIPITGLQAGRTYRYAIAAKSSMNFAISMSIGGGPNYQAVNITTTEQEYSITRAFVAANETINLNFAAAAESNANIEVAYLLVQDVTP